MDVSQARIPYERCPLCESTDFVVEKVGNCSRHPLYKPALPETQRWLRCRHCNHVYVDGYFSPEALSLIFSSAVPARIPGQNKIEKARYTSARMVEMVCDWLPEPGGRWLDVGFGNGALMTTAAEFGFHAVGIDLRENVVKLMQQFGYEAHALKFEDYQSSELFDVISMCDVLEHMPFPKPALRHAWNLLCKGGLLFVSMPNADSFLWEFLTKKGTNPYWGELEHCHNFGRRRLYALLAECGFAPVRYGVSSRYRACMEVVARKSVLMT